MDVSSGEMVEFGVEIRQRCVSRALLSVVMPGPVVNRQAFATACFIITVLNSYHPLPHPGAIVTTYSHRNPACLPSPNSAEGPPLILN